MADPEFWRRAENKFRRLQTAPPKPGEVQHSSHNGLCAWWAPEGWDDGKVYHFFDDGHDLEANTNIERLFWYAAESAGVELGYPEGEVAVFAWLDRLRLAGLYLTPGTWPGSTIIYRVCDASAEYCLKCETEAKAAAREARTQEGGGGQERIDESARESLDQDSSDRPLGDNPFPQDHPAHAAFEEATWKAKTKIARFKLEFLRTNFDTQAGFIQSLLTFRKRWFSVVAFEATLIVGSEETAQWYERWIEDCANWLLQDTRSQTGRKDPAADPAAPAFFSPDDLKHIESDLTLELLGMVTHYKGVAAQKVLEVIELRNAAQTAAPGESKGVQSDSVSPAEASQDSRVDDTPLPGTAAGAKADSAKNNRPRSPRPPLEAVAKDEERREKGKENLVRALQSYINKLGQAKDRDAHRETEIFCDYARENYASRAEPYFEAMPPMDPQELFEVGDLTERRDLTGLPTIGDVLERVKDVKVRRPNHWPDPPGIYRGDEPPKLRRALRELIISEHESFGWLLEEPWDHWFRQQVRDCIKGCVHDKRKEYERRFTSQLTPEESKSAENHNETDGTRTAKVYKTILGRNINRLRRDCGWSFDVLADKTGLDKKLILGHINEGKPARARTLKTYADAFARELKRPVTVAELEA